MLETFIGEQIGQLLADHLNQLGFGDVVVDEACDAINIPLEGKTKSNIGGFREEEKNPKNPKAETETRTNYVKKNNNPPLLFKCQNTRVILCLTTLWRCIKAQCPQAVSREECTWVNSSTKL